MYKRNCTNYIFSFAFFSFLVTVYILGLRQSKQIGTGFNLKPPKVKRDIVTRNDIRVSNERKLDTVSASKVAPVRVQPKEVGNHEHPGEVQEQDIRLADDNGDEQDGKEPVGIYIVEEHHEVIPRWFGAARRGLIPKSGNTLIHIDGHADLAPLYYLPGYPFFKWPADKQLKYLMQTNDAFIQASGIAGLVNRVIWVWPEWDSNNHEAQYVMSTLSLGWVAVRSAENRRQKQRAFCLCLKNETGVDCRSLVDLNGDVNPNKTDGGFVIPRHKCNIVRILIVEEIHENKAVSYLGRPEWIAKSESIIIDIDEDYYGCSYAIEPLLSANVSFQRVKRIDELIKAQLCPISTEHERRSDLFLLELISLVRIKRACDIDKTLTNSTKCRIASKMNAVKHFESKLRSLETNQTIRLCKNNDDRKVVQVLTQAFSRLRIKDLKALQSVGFCCNTSPKTLDLYGNRKFGICYGMNTPEATAVSVHIPTTSEITSRTILLKGLLRKLNKYSPRLVTVSRSVRDGYTPRQFFEQIEDNIITALQGSIDQTTELHYDKDLLGGKPGWPARHKV